MDMNNLKNVVASADIRLGQKIDVMETITELEDNNQKLEFIEDFLYNNLGWSKEYLINRYNRWLQSKNKL